MAKRGTIRQRKRRKMRKRRTNRDESKELEKNNAKKRKGIIK
jgi:hypothetical protein